VFSSRTHKFRRLFPSPWIVVGAALILLMVVVVLAVHNINREKAYMSQILSEKGAALIKAFEAGARTGMMGMMWGGNQVQRLLEETAQQPDIIYLMVSEREGRILAHSDPALIGATLAAVPEADDHERWRLTTLPDGRTVFEVFRLFKPLQGGRGGGPHGMGRRRAAAVCPPGVQGQNAGDWCFPADPEKGAQVIFAGFDIAPFENARQEDIHNTLAISGVLALLGLGGFVSLFWAQHYRRARRSFQDASAFAKEVVASLPVGLIATDRKGRIAFFNEAAEAITDLDFLQVRGQALEAVLSSHWGGLRDGLVQGGRIFEREMECTFKPDRRVPVSVSASRIVNEDGAFVGHVIILRNLEEIRHLQAEIRRKEKLAALGGLAAGVAHEIRNPLSSIKGMASYFGSKFSEDSGDWEAAQVMIGEVDRLNRVISELLDFARPSELNRQPTDMAALLARTFRLIAQDAAAKNIAMHQQCLLAADDRPVLDGDRMAQCLLNLYLNALQAMPDGGALMVRIDRSAEGGLVIEVSDTGAGIPADRLPRIFDPYFTTKTSGTGLGLAIVHKIIEAHGGRVRVFSELARGTRFHLEMPPQPGETEGGADAG
jgi:two-component system sensor histidine kinase HydH